MSLDNGGNNGSASSNHPAVEEFLRTIEGVRQKRGSLKKKIRHANNMHAAESHKQKELRKKLRECIKTVEEESDRPPDSLEDLEELDDLDDITVDNLIPYRPELDSSEALEGLDDR